MTNRNKASGTAFENRVVKRARTFGLSAVRQPLSGVLKSHPSDMVVEGWLGEAKTYTVHPSMTQMMEWLEKVQTQAKKAKFTGGFLVYNQKRSRRPIVMLSLDDFLALLERGLDKSAKM